MSHSSDIDTFFAVLQLPRCSSRSGCQAVWCLIHPYCNTCVRAQTSVLNGGQTQGRERGEQLFVADFSFASSVFLSVEICLWETFACCLSSAQQWSSVSGYLCRARNHLSLRYQAVCLGVRWLIFQRRDHAIKEVVLWNMLPHAAYMYLSSSTGCPWVFIMRQFGPL